MKDFWDPTRLLKLVIFVCFLMVIALTVVFVEQRNLDEHIDQLEDVQFESQRRYREVKGIACRIEHAMGLGSSEACVTPELLEEWSPEDSISPHFQPVDRE